ncbi:site-specific integrase [Dechloromonas sp. ZY10]|uniref:tyrosine-type recombinase/integrase n=1 Tax=Dechloromonas aquae TaxID=2664436 RepID=UPI003529D268
MPEQITLAAWADRYLSDIRTLKSCYSVSSVIRAFSARDPSRPLADLRGSDIHDYAQSRLAAGIRSTTINRELSVLSAAINHACRRWGVSVTENPVKYQWLRAAPLRLRYLDRIEADRLIAAADALRPVLGDFVRLALHTGCRKTELLTLRWSDVDLLRRFFVLRPENTKTARRRAVPLNKTALGALHALKARGPVGAEWVFSKPSGDRVKSLDWLFRKAVKEAGISDFRIHDLRHTCASWLVSEGVELVKVRDLLGHTSIKMTERYAHLMPSKLHSAVEVLDMFAA